VQQLGTIMRLLSAYNVVLPSLYNAGGAIDLRTLVDGVRRAVSSDDSSSSSLSSSQLRLDLLHLIAAAGISAKQLLKVMICILSVALLCTLCPNNFFSINFIED